MRNEELEGIMADEIKTDAAVEEKKPQKPKRARRIPMGPTDLGVSFSVITEKTALEKFSRKLAMRQLRDALACHQPVVKLCVAERLSKHKSYAELAQQFFLTEEEVVDIMTRIRPLVRRYTTYFDSDWYWKDTGEKRELFVVSNAPQAE